MLCTSRIGSQTPSAIDECLKLADEQDVQVTIHTDTLNESGYVDDTLAAIGGRTIHAYHTEGAGGGRKCLNTLFYVQKPTIVYSL